MYKRVLLKLSGESLAGKNPQGIDPKRLKEFCQQIATVSRQGTEIGIVLGGGNIFRGLKGVSSGFDRIKGDYMGMLATVINGLALQSELEAQGILARHFTAIKMEPVAEGYQRDKVIDSLGRKEVVIFSAGTGNPFFTTDTAAALRAIEMNAEVLLKGTRVEGVYSADPEKDKSAIKFDSLTFEEAYKKGLNIMDLTAFTLCNENKLPVIVFNMHTAGNLLSLVNGKKIGTLITHLNTKI
jgi:uridylate kinase